MRVSSRILRQRKGRKYFKGRFVFDARTKAVREGAPYGIQRESADEHNHKVYVIAGEESGECRGGTTYHRVHVLALDSK